MNQISENLLTAIDILIQERLKELPFDKTIIGTIVDITQAPFGQYTILYNGLQFIAYSSIQDLVIGDQVYVTTPENDSNEKRLIIGKYIIEPSIQQTFSLVDNLVIYGEIKIDNINELQSYTDYKNIPQKMIFTGELTSDQQEFNIEICINNNLIFVFTNNDVIGIPNQLSTSYQEKMFDLDALDEIQTISIKSNIGLENVNLIFGDDIINYSNISTSAIIIQTLNSLTYDKTAEKTLYANYLEKQNNIIAKKRFSRNTWYKYIVTSYGNENMDASWGLINDVDKECITTEVLTDRPFMKYKSVSDNIESNYLTFENTAYTSQDIFDLEAVYTSDYKLVVNLKDSNNNIIKDNVITSNQSEYQLDFSIVDSYTNSQKATNEDLKELVKISLLNNKSVNLNLSNNKITASSYPAYGIIKITCWWNDYQYIAYLTIAWRNTEEYHTFTGATQIEYNSSGVEPMWNHSSYSLEPLTNNLTWKIEVLEDRGLVDIKENETLYQQFPQFLDNKLIPNSIFINDLKLCCITAYLDQTLIWIQPIAIIKEGIVENTTITLNNNLIQNPVLSLCRLEEDGTISGVFAGIRKSEIDDNATIEGFYGFNHGKRFFELSHEAFRVSNELLIQIDGKAEIGDIGFGDIVATSELEAKIQQLNTEIGSLKTTDTSINSQIATMQTIINNLTSRIVALESKIQ